MFVAPATATTTNIIDIAALADCGTGSTNGWTLSGIDSYADKTSVRINNSAEYLLSPDFPYAIREIIVYIKSSSKSGSILAFTPRINGQFCHANEVLCTYSPNKDSYVRQSISFGDCPPPSGDCPSVTSFKIAYSIDNDGNTGWGISYMAVVTDDTPVLLPPQNAKILQTRATSVKLQWNDSSPTTSNLVSVFQLNEIPESYSIATNYDFNLCYGHGSSGNADQALGFHELYPDFTADKIYYPISSTGIVQISTTKANGRITHLGFNNYSNLALEVSARRPDTDKSSRLYVYYIDSGQQTNIIGVALITNIITSSIIQLSGTPDGVAIHFGNLDGFKSDRRYLIDRITFLSDYTYPHTETNLVASLVTTNSTITIKGLNRKTEHLINIAAFDSSGNRSVQSPPLHFMTCAHNPGFIATFK